MNLSQAIMTDHAAEQARERQIDIAVIRFVLGSPDDVSPIRPGRVVAQRVIENYMIRVFVDIDRSPPEVVTVYRTSKISKYRSRP